MEEALRSFPHALARRTLILGNVRPWRYIALWRTSTLGRENREDPTNTTEHDHAPS